jgi:hypothetical protein
VRDNISTFCPDFEFDLIFSGEGGGSREILNIMVVLLILNEPILFEELSICKQSKIRRFHI